MAKENKPASAYSKPHTMAGKSVSVVDETRAQSGAKRMTEINPSVAGISKGTGGATKTDGITIRGYGAATKGIKARGPMA